MLNTSLRPPSEDRAELGDSLPNGWRTLTLDKIALLQTGIAVNAEVERLDPVRLPYLRVANVQDGHIDLSEIKHIVIGRDQVSRYSLKNGDVLMTEGGDFDKLGRGAVWNAEIEPCVHQNHVFAVRPDSTIILSSFLAAYCESAVGRRYFLSCSKQTTNLASINSTQLKAMPVTVPPLGEQQQIMDILDTWKCMIRQTELLIAAKKQRWRILIAEMRANRWRSITLNELGRWVGGGTPSKANAEYWTDGLIPWVSPKDMIGWQIGSAEDFITADAVVGSSTQLIPSGSVLIVTRSGILRSRVPIGVASREMAINQDIKALIPGNPDDGPLLAALLLDASERLRQATMKTGTTVESIDFEGLKAFRLQVPTSKDDIDAANAVLVGGLHEIDVLDKLLDHFRTQKRGLMQNLFSGKYRPDDRFGSTPDPLLAERAS